MSWSSWQEGAGGGMLVDGRQDGGRVNNTQLIALFPSSWRKKERNIVTSSERSAKLRASQLGADGPRCRPTAATGMRF